jgi:tRNA(adenine34) deaminase
MSTDEDFMRQAIALGDGGRAAGELPFGALVVNPSGTVIGASQQMTVRGKDYSQHAEVAAMAVAAASFKAANGKLQGCTLYSTVEPCAMCSFIARQYEVARVVFGLKAPITGGVSHWHVLDDDTINKTVMGFLNMAFAAPPVIVPGVLVDEVMDGWARWNLIEAEALWAAGVFVKA